ncbi:hypothetical protein JCM11251_003300 [Rhodosporidiobolus azoricus]
MDATAITPPPAMTAEQQEANKAGGTSFGFSETRGEVGGGGAATPATPTFFREMLEDLDEPIPTVKQLETFGLFDLSKSERLLAAYRETHPSPVSPVCFTPASPTVEAPTPSPPRRPSEPHHRHSLAVLPVQAKYDAATLSPTSPTASPRLNPFAFVRKATIRPRPSQRAKSASDVQAVPPLPAPSLNDPKAFFAVGTEGQEVSNPRTSFSLSRTETVKENRAPRKLRKSVAPKITVRTDDDFLLRPFSGPVAVPSSPEQDTKDTSSPSSSPSDTRPAPIRLPSWRSSTSSIVVSPVSYTYPRSTSPATTGGDHHHGPRPPSPVGSFPASIRRENALPPVEAKKRGSSTTSSSTDDYLADNERVARFSPRASRTRFGSSGGGGGGGGVGGGAPASPTGSSTGGGVWGKLRLGGKKGSRPSSIASVDSSSTWEVVDAAEGAAAAPQARSFEVVGRPSSRPPTERSVYHDSLNGAAAGGGTAAPLDSPTLSRIMEQSEVGTGSSKRSSLASGPSTSTSIDSLLVASGATTPNGLQHHGVSAASSMTAGGASVRPGMPRSRPSSNLNLTTAASFSSLRSHPPSPLAPTSPSASVTGKTSPSPSPFFVGAVHHHHQHHAADPSASSTSLISGSWPSSRSSRSRDSLFFSAEGEEGGDGEGFAYGEAEGEGGDGETPASSALEEDEDEVAAVALTPGRERGGPKKRDQQPVVPLLERLVIEEQAALASASASASAGTAV